LRRGNKADGDMTPRSPRWTNSRGGTRLHGARRRPFLVRVWRPTAEGETIAPRGDPHAKFYARIPA
jgi:hypothetical protein